MKLAQLQEAFQAHVLCDEPAIGAQIASDARFPAALRLGIYSQGYATRLVEVLSETFPAVHGALGADRFADLIGEFVCDEPSRVRSARDYGGALPEWLAATLRGPRAAGIGDLARFEWAVAAAFDAADATALQPATLAAVVPLDWPRLRFIFAPSLRRLDVSSNCVAWWKFACADQARPGRWRATCAQHWLVWRRDLAVYYRRMPQAETRALDAAVAGSPFGQLCEELDDPSRAATLLHGWFSEGLVSGVDLAPAAG